MIKGSIRCVIVLS